MEHKKETAIRNYRITFPRQTEVEWPKHFKRLFGDVKKLGSTGYDAWVKDSITRARWRTDIAAKAAELADAAQELKAKGKAADEIRWRGLEGRFFKHLDYEPRCGRCQGRTWQSGVSIPFAEFGTKIDNIEPGMKRRECNCDIGSVRGTRVSFTFGSIGGPPFAYDAAIQKAIGRKSEAPDLVFGLRSKGRVHKYAESLRRTEFAKDVSLSPFKPRNQEYECMFPFLLSEAKAAKAKVTPQDITDQMAFAIRQALITQQDLSIAVNEIRVFEPLVWAVALRGELCEIHGAYFKGTYPSNQYKKDDPKPKIVITRLWYGMMSDNSAALQLLLIIDYIAEWARHIYREQILDCMAEIVNIDDDSGGDSDSSHESCRSFNNAKFYHPVDPTGYTSSETGQNGNVSPESSAHPTPASTPTQTAHQTESPGETLSPVFHSPLPRRVASRTPLSSEEMCQSNETLDFLLGFDGAECVFRDAIFIESRTAGIVITSDNIEDFIRIGGNHRYGALSRLATQLKKYELARVSGGMLVSMIEAWTSSCPSSLAHRKIAKEDAFYVLFNFAAYLSPDWKQVRELSYIAVSASEIVRVQEHGTAKGKGFSYDEVDPERAKSMIDAFRSATVHANLCACLYRVSLHPVLKKARGKYDGNILYKCPELKPVYMATASAYKAPPRNYIWDVAKNRDGDGGTMQSFNPHFHQSFNVERQMEPSNSDAESGAPWTGFVIPKSDWLVLGEDEFYSRRITVQHSRRWCLFAVGESALSPEKRIPMRDVSLKSAYQTCRHSQSKGWEMEGWNCTMKIVTGSHISDISRKFISALLGCLNEVTGKPTTPTNAAAQMANLEPNAAETPQPRSRRSNPNTLNPNRFVSASSGKTCKQKLTDWSESTSEDELARQVQDCSPSYKRRNNK